LAEDAVVLELRREETGVVWVVGEWQVTELGKSTLVEKPRSQRSTSRAARVE
jgi:hypothetical protein